MRLIDADIAKSVLNILADKGESDVVWLQAIDVIDSLPTIEAETRRSVTTIWTDGEPPVYVPVRHGKWIEDSDGDGRHCSFCGRDYCYVITDCESWAYCPNCGARMDEE